MRRKFRKRKSCRAGARRCPIPCTPCIGSFGAGAHRCSVRCIPCICSCGAGARRCLIPCIPCIGSVGAGARSSIPCIPCICSFRAGARRCSIHCIPCSSSLCAGARRCPILRSPCIYSFGGRAGTASAGVCFLLVCCCSVTLGLRLPFVFGLPCGGLRLPLVCCCSVTLPQPRPAAARQHSIGRRPDRPSFVSVGVVHTNKTDPAEWILARKFGKVWFKFF